jgi:hypothetical protein
MEKLRYMREWIARMACDRQLRTWFQYVHQSSGVRHYEGLKVNSASAGLTNSPKVRTARGARKAASDTTLQNMVRDKTSPNKAVRHGRLFTISIDGPSSLVRSTKTRTIVTVEELVEEHIVPEMGITIELRVSTIRSSASIHILSKYVDNAMLDFFRNLVQWHRVTTPSGALDLKVIPIVLVETLKRLDKEEVGCQPDWSTPIGVATKHARVRVAGPVCNFVVLSFDIHRVRMVLVVE